MKIYTKTGDKGITGLFGGKRVPKNAPRIEAYGDVDELNAVIGIAIAETSHEPIRKALQEIQAALFTVGAQLSSPETTPKIEVITSAHVDALERQIDVITQDLPEIKHFILPGGNKSSAYLHHARTVCRRAERSVVGLAQISGESVDKWVVIYLNRLSDYLFMTARLANQLEKIEDVSWVGK